MDLLFKQQKTQWTTWIWVALCKTGISGEFSFKLIHNATKKNNNPIDQRKNTFSKQFCINTLNLKLKIRIFYTTEENTGLKQPKVEYSWLNCNILLFSIKLITLLSIALIILNNMTICFWVLMFSLHLCQGFFFCCAIGWKPSDRALHDG